MNRTKTEPHNPDVIRRDLEGWCDKLKNNSVEADARQALDALIHDARKLLRDMESVLQQQPWRVDGDEAPRDREAALPCVNDEVQEDCGKG